MSKKKVDLHKLLPSQAKEEIKKNIEEEEEQIEVLGQESEEKAVKWVQEVEKEQEHIENEKSAVEQTKAHDAKNKFFTYQTAILNTARRRMVEYDEFVPKGFYWVARLARNEKIRGLEIWIRDRKDKFYTKAMKISGDPQYDLNWIDRAIQSGIDQMEELDKKYTEEKQLLEKFEIEVDGKKIYL